MPGAWSVERLEGHPAPEGLKRQMILQSSAGGSELKV